jgi:predicted TIM-barrel fold metal-dependent hydrolase
MSATAIASTTDNAAAQKELILSADSHVIEPADLWETRLPAAFREQAPRFPDDREGVGLHKHAGAWNPAERVKEMAVDGVSGEVLYTTKGLNMFLMDDAALQEACCQVFNDWLIEYCAAAPDRLFGVGMIPTYDVAHGIAELERCRKLGLRGGMVWQAPPADLPFTSDRYDRFWAAAQDLDMPISLHILTGHTYLKNPNARSAYETWRGSVNLKLVEIMNSIYDLIFYGALDRFPRLKIVVVENEIGWLPFALQQWDFYLRKNAHEGKNPPLRQMPSEYLGQQLFATFFNDAIGTRYLDSWGQDAAMWSNDYPHPNSTWPNSREVIGRHLGHLGPEARKKVLSDNMARLYNIAVPSVL